MKKIIAITILLFSISGCTLLQPGEEDITVSTPQPNDTISSPLTVEGEARGSWFFEGSFPITLTDNSGNSIAQSTAVAQGEWMTEDYVPFVGEIYFETDETEAILVLEKDNPSDLPENADQISLSLYVTD